MRVQGGTRGILSAIAAGWLDPLDPNLDEPPAFSHLSGSDFRLMRRRELRRLRKARRRERELSDLAGSVPF